jgi:uncharacterized protein
VFVICPSCKKRTPWDENPFRPFCSDRCRMTDLGKWAAEEYKIEAASQDGEDNEKDKGGEL